MKLLDAIGKNLSLYQEMTQARVPYDFLKKLSLIHISEPTRPY